MNSSMSPKPRSTRLLISPSTAFSSALSIHPIASSIVQFSGHWRITSGAGFSSRSCLIFLSPSLSPSTKGTRPDRVRRSTPKVSITAESCVGTTPTTAPNGGAAEGVSFNARSPVSITSARSLNHSCSLRPSGITT